MEKEDDSTEMTVCFDTNMGLFGHKAFGTADKPFVKEPKMSQTMNHSFSGVLKNMNNSSTAFPKPK